MAPYPMERMKSPGLLQRKALPASSMVISLILASWLCTQFVSILPLSTAARMPSFPVPQVWPDALAVSWKYCRVLVTCFFNSSNASSAHLPCSVESICRT